MLAKVNNIEEILSSLDGIKRAEVPAFLYGKITARLNSSENSLFEKFSKLISRPAIVISFLFIFLFMDGVVFQSFLKSMPEKSENSSEEFSTSDNLDEMLFYDVSDSEYASVE